jgi:hypothetical protein
VLPRLVEIAAGISLSAWFAGCVVANVLPRRAWIRRTRFSWLLPEWRFFAPNPATHDYDVFCRFRSEQLGPTAAAVIRFPARRPGNLLLNPHSRARKATRDAIEELLNTAHGSPASGAQQGRPASAPANLGESSEGYAALLREASSLAPKSHDAIYVQFGVLLVEGTDRPRLLFVSRWEEVA